MVVFRMHNMTESVETKVILPPAAFVQLFFALKGGDFIEGIDAELDALIQTMDFPIGDAGKTAKLSAAQEGNVIVSRSIVLTAQGADRDMRVLLSQRNDQHKVTTGGSILVSGDIRKKPEEILAKKIVFPSSPVIEFKRMGFALSSPEQTKGIHYLFEIFRARLETLQQVTSLGDDSVNFVGLDDAMNAINGKPLEQKIARRLQA